MREGQTLNAALPGETVEIEVPKGVKHNDRVFRTFDKKLMDYAQRFCGEEGKNRIPVKAFVKAKLREALQITLTDDEGNRAEAATSFIAEAARKHSLNYETLHKQLDRMGNTEYVLTELLLDCDENIMVPCKRNQRSSKDCDGSSQRGAYRGLCTEKENETQKRPALQQGSAGSSKQQG
jgi:putative protease